ncbi:MAG TPA: ATP-binding protein [Ktedonobacteraceae bacterium]|nr:ATP-binding protein [Ktedonobacteraceae bacterium]
MSTPAGKISDNSQRANVFSPGEKLFRALIENSSDAIALVSHEGLFTYVSPSVQKILGFTPEELLGHNTLELFPPDHLPAALEQFDTVAKTPGLTVTVEHTCIHKDGSLRWLESTITNHLHDPHIQAFVANFRDISERKQAEERQHILDQVSNLVVSSLDQQITLTEIAQLLVPSLADYCRIAILDEQHQIQEIAVNHTDPEKVALVQALYDQYKDQAEPVYGVQKLLRTGQPELISNVSQDVLAHIQVHPDMLDILRELALKSYMGVPLIAHGRIIGAITFSSVQPSREYTKADLYFAQELARRIASALDNVHLYRQAQAEIRERKNVEEALRESEARKDEFISMASHELKTPLTSLKGFTNLLQRRLTKQGDKQALHFLARMEEQLDKLTKLVSELLDVTKMQTGKLEFREERFFLNELVRETLENLQGTTETHHLQLEEVTDAQVPGDKDRLGQVLINLLTNAIKYSPEANTVIVRVSADEHNAIVSVQDFGIGIAETHQEKIFERFYQVNDDTEKTFRGLGIGLYISSQIVRGHHGRLWVESAKGAGATFYVSLPLARES